MMNAHCMYLSVTVRKPASLNVCDKSSSLLNSKTTFSIIIILKNNS